MDRIGGIQDRALRLLFNNDRLQRMSENEALNGAQAYSPFELFDNVSESIFSGGKRAGNDVYTCLLYTSPSPRDKRQSRMPSSA